MGMASKRVRIMVSSPLTADWFILAGFQKKL